MVKVTFTSEQIEQLAYHRFHHPRPRVRIKLEAVYLRAKGLKQREICELIGICANTLRSYLREFAAGGVEGLMHFDAGGSVCVLDEFTDLICEHLVEHPPHTIAEAAEKIERLTGVRRSQTQVREYLKRIGFRRLKVGSLPAKADPAEQERFKKTSLSHG